jgi:hypothetical protein
MARKNGAGRDTAAAQSGIRLTAHPRARRDIAMAKGWGGLAAFGVVVLLSLRAGVPLTDALWRALIGGMAGYVLAWGAAVAVWRHVALAEIDRRTREIAAPPPEAQPPSAAEGRTA